MSTQRPRRGRDVSVGGSITGNVIGNGNSNIDITVGRNVESDSVSLDDLREAIALLRVEFEAADSRVQYELQTIQDELRGNEPDGETVRSRWKQVLKLLGPLKDLATVAQTTTAILASSAGTNQALKSTPVTS